MFTGRLIDETPECWRWGIGKDDRRAADASIATIAHLKGRGLDGAGVIGSYHRRRFAPLMVHSLPIFKVSASIRVVGLTVMAVEPLPDAEVAKRLKAALAPMANPWP